MGSAMGQCPEILEEVCTWVNRAATVPVWAKMTPNITHIEEPGRAALRAGCEGLSAINTILSVMGVNLETLRPEPTVEDYTVPGGYSCKAVRPIALRMVMELATMMYGGGNGGPISSNGELPIRGEFPDRSLSAIGGIETGDDAAQFLLLGASTLQVCTGVMIHGYKLIHTLNEQLGAFMDRHGFSTIDEFRGQSLRYFTTHADLVKRQAAVKAAERAARQGMVTKDTAWEGERFVEQSSKLVANQDD
jgi:dihydropyrimidine dehydrogenase (NADP+)/dihydropyrimidine dehydrogenase (NAD+) subunit PreA